MQIGVADVSDGPEISAFFDGLTIPTRVPVTVSRGRDCFALGRLRGGESFWLVARADDGIQAAMEVACIPMVWQGFSVTVAYVAFAGVAQKWRRTGLLRTLAEEAEALVRARGCTIGAYLHSRANRAAADAALRIKRGTIATEPIHISVMPASRRLCADPALCCGPAAAADVSTAAELLRRRYAGYTLAPAEDLPSLLARLSLPDDACWVARDPSGAVVAFVAYVDASEFRPTTLGRLPVVEAVLRAAANMAAPLLGIPALPKRGELIRLAYALAPAAIDSRALGAVVRAVLAHLAERGFHGLLLALPGRDPLRRELAPWWTLTNVTLPSLVPGDPDIDRAVRSVERPVFYLEYALH
ncbi:MAG: GNAT family N-acetyltransferase [Syntrophales bacterium]